jgi:hypothetical protein
MFEPQNPLYIKALVANANKQNAFGTAIPDANFTKTQRHDPNAYANRMPQFRSDADRAGKLHPYGTEYNIIRWDSDLSGNVEADVFLLGELLSLILGNDVVTGANPYTHTMNFQQSSRQAPVTTLLLQDTADIKYKMPDLALAKLDISGGPGGVLQIAFQFVGSGRTVEGVATAIPALPNNVYLYGSDTTILLGPQAAAVDISQRVESWTISIMQELETHRAPGNTFYAVQHNILAQRVSAQLVVSAKDVDDIRSILLAGTIRELQINTNSGAAAQLNLKLPGMFFTGAPMSNSGNRAIYTITSEPQAVIKSGGNEPIVAVLINSQPTYLVGA